MRSALRPALPHPALPTLATSPPGSPARIRQAASEGGGRNARGDRAGPGVARLVAPGANTTETVLVRRSPSLRPHPLTSRAPPPLPPNLSGFAPRRSCVRPPGVGQAPEGAWGGQVWGGIGIGRAKRGRGTEEKKNKGDKALSARSNPPRPCQRLGTLGGPRPAGQRGKGLQGAAQGSNACRRRPLGRRSGARTPSLIFSPSRHSKTHAALLIMPSLPPSRPSLLSVFSATVLHHPHRRQPAPALPPGALAFRLPFPDRGHSAQPV